MSDIKEENYVNPYRKDFPLLCKSKVIYLDNAATAQKPQCVIEAEKEFYEKFNANPLRGIYKLGIAATEYYEQARETVRKFINAKKKKEVIFTRNTTESINLVAYSYGLANIKEDEEIVVTIMEHHSNLLPWQMVAKQTGAKLKFLECEIDGKITDESIEKSITEKTKIVAVTYISNIFGRINPIDKIIEAAHKHDAKVIVDAAQGAPHIPIDVSKSDVDFLAFSGHKLMAPMGIGVLYGKEELLDNMDPFMTGGEMIEYVTRDKARFAETPQKFEAGTVNAGGAVALAKGIEYINKIGFDKISERENKLTKIAIDGMREIPGINIIGSKKSDEHCGIITFTVDKVHPHDVASILDDDGIAVRAGHHCAQPLMDYLNISSSVRASIAFYNDKDDIVKFIYSLESVRRKMGYAE